MNVQKPHDTGRASHHTAPKPASQETQKKGTTLAADNNIDKLEQKADVTYKPAYTKGANRSENRSIDSEDFRARAGKSARQLKNDAVSSMVSAQVNGQINKSAVGKLNFGKTPDALNALRAAEATSAKHDDYWGVEATAERLFTFAKTLAGGDDSKFQTLKNAFLEGFRQAAGARGGNLPSISYQTRDRVLQMFDQWESEINAKKNGTPAPAETQK
ncbi:MAG: hypothetical protein FWE74_07130 [Oscillospiraceae bacterium]|nr:hypothetical protein [Oscillospiraceae bacterium]